MLTPGERELTGALVVRVVQTAGGVGVYVSQCIEAHLEAHV